MLANFRGGLAFVTHCECFRSLWFAAGVDTDVSSAGIVQGHAYAILNAVEESDAKGSYQLVQLRNPWGQTEW